MGTQRGEEIRYIGDLCGLKEIRRMEGRKRETEKEMGYCEELKAVVREEKWIQEK